MSAILLWKMRVVWHTFRNPGGWYYVFSYHNCCIGAFYAVVGAFYALCSCCRFHFCNFFKGRSKAIRHTCLLFHLTGFTKPVVLVAVCNKQVGSTLQVTKWVCEQVRWFVTSRASQVDRVDHVLIPSVAKSDRFSMWTITGSANFCVRRTQWLSETSVTEPLSAAQNIIAETGYIEPLFYSV